MSEEEVSAEETFAKVRLTSHDGQQETLWAVRVGADRFELRNVPMFAYGVSDNDIVEGAEYAEDMFDFVRVVQPSGNRTIRVILEADAKADTEAGKAVIAGLTDLGCTYENFNGSWIGVVVPPDVDIDRVSGYLNGTNLRWEMANPAPLA